MSLSNRGGEQVVTLGEILLIHDLKRQGLSVSAIARMVVASKVLDAASPFVVRQVKGMIDVVLAELGPAQADEVALGLIGAGAVIRERDAVVDALGGEAGLGTRQRREL